VVVQLLGEFVFRVFQPVEDVSPYWVRQGFYYFVEVEVHGVGSWGQWRYIAMERTLNRWIAIYQYENGLSIL
jgi:hypothetical protein